MWHHLSHYGDIAAIPVFILIIIYFYQIENKNPFEWMIFSFSIIGLLFDIYFTIMFILSFRIYHKGKRI